MPHQTLTHKTTRKLYTKKPAADETARDLQGRRRFTWEESGQEEVTYQVDIDQDGLDQLARKAAASKSGKSKDGPLTVTIIARAKEGEGVQ